MKQNTKILMLISELGYGGAETSFIRLANFLRQQGICVEVAMFTQHYVGEYATTDHEELSCNVHILDGISQGWFARWVGRWRKLRKLKRDCDICISFLSGPNSLNVATGFNKKSIVTMQGSRMFDPLMVKHKRWLFQHIIDPIIYRLARYIVPVCAGLQSEVRLQAGDYAASKCRVIPPMALLESFSKRAKMELPPKFEQLKNQPVICSVGRLSFEKGFQYLIPIFAKLAQQQTGAKLLLVGDGPMGDELRQMCERLGIVVDSLEAGVDSVIFVGYQSNPLPFMRLGQLYVMSSMTEGLPNVLLEALSTGATIIAADAPWGARAVLQKHASHQQPYQATAPEPSDYGVLMPRIDDTKNHEVWAQTLVQYLTQEDVRRGYAKAGEVCLREFDVESVGRKWMALVEEFAA